MYSGRYRAIDFPEEEIRLDIDGILPQGLISGLFTHKQGGVLYGISALVQAQKGYVGCLKFHEANTPSEEVDIQVRLLSTTAVEIEFLTANFPRRQYEKISEKFGFITFDLWNEVGLTPIREYVPDRRYDEKVPTNNLSLQYPWEQAGYHVDIREHHDLIIEGRNPNQRWHESDLVKHLNNITETTEPHGHFRIQVLNTRKHEIPGLRGLVFETSPGMKSVAIFSQEIAEGVPETESKPNQWINRMIFFVTVHELGHIMGLAHPWENLGANQLFGLSPDRSTFSFMNYPWSYTGGSKKFFSNFEYRFTNHEIAFLRHGPHSYHGALKQI